MFTGSWRKGIGSVLLICAVSVFLVPSNSLYSAYLDLRTGDALCDETMKKLPTPGCRKKLRVLERELQDLVNKEKFQSEEEG